MAKARFELILPGLNELMQGPEMQGALQAAGEAVAGAADGNYGVRVHQASYVAIANVYPDDRASAKKNYESNELLKAVGAVGLRMGS